MLIRQLRRLGRRVVSEWRHGMNTHPLSPEVNLDFRFLLANVNGITIYSPLSNKSDIRLLLSFICLRMIRTCPIKMYSTT